MHLLLCERLRLPLLLLCTRVWVRCVLVSLLLVHGTDMQRGCGLLCQCLALSMETAVTITTATSARIWPAMRLVVWAQHVETRECTAGTTT